MKIIHCADLHLDSAMSSGLPGEMAKERRAELLNTFDRMVRYASDNGIDAIIIAGDLFDTRRVSETAGNAVLDAVSANPRIDFYYLRGNHDADGFFNGRSELPENLKLFGDNWRYYPAGRDGGISIIGAEPGAGGYEELYASLAPAPDKFNIVVMHGQVSLYGADGSRETLINLRALEHRGIDYLALGHLHAYRTGTLDARGRYCYPGCIEGRGFDECGEHGFVLLEIDEESHDCAESFVPFAGRNLYEPEVDISGCMTTFEITAAIRSSLGKAGYSRRSLLKITLTGSVDYDCEKNLDFLAKQFEGDYYFVKIADRTKYRVDYGRFALDQSLKGEFVRTVMADAGLSEEDKAEVIRCGIKTLAGEVPDICGL